MYNTVGSQYHKINFYVRELAQPFRLLLIAVAQMIFILPDPGVSAFMADADFSLITGHMAFVSEVQQNTYIAIDENGVEAAAFTEVGYVGSAPPQGRVGMILDRPFIYGITAENGILLFVGVCENPTK